MTSHVAILPCSPWGCCWWCSPAASTPLRRPPPTLQFLAGRIAGLPAARGAGWTRSRDPHPPPVPVACALRWPGGVIGAISNGVLVARFHVAPFVATLGMLYVVRGVALLMTNGRTLNDLSGTGWIEATFPGAEVLTEQPIAWRNENDQVMEGWIDALLKLPNGEHVLVDHKSYPGTDPIGHVRENYLGQLETYSRALKAAGERPPRVLVHLPLLGAVAEVHASGSVTSVQ